MGAFAEAWAANGRRGMSGESNLEVAENRDGDPSDCVREWVKRAQRGDREAFNQLFELLSNQIRSEARAQFRQQRPESSLSDLLQVAWTRAFQKFDQFQGDDSSDEAMIRSLRGWLRKIVRRTASNVHRGENQLKRKPPALQVGQEDLTVRRLATNDPTPSQICTSEEMLDRLKVQCESIDDPMLREFIKARLDGKTKAQYAREHGMSEHQVRAAEAKVFKQLETKLKDSGQ